jgi:cell division protein FtsZ
MAMSEFIRNLDVSLKLFLLLRDWFYIYYAKRSKQQPKAIERQNRTFSFDLPVRKPQPIQKVEENNAYAELTSEARDIKVNQPVEFVPVTEVVDRGIIKYSLEEYILMILKF